MKHEVKVRIKTTNKSKLLLKLNSMNINMKNIQYKDKYLIFETSKEEVKRIKKYLLSEKVEIISELGIDKIKSELKRNMLFIVSIIFSILLFLILSNIIIKVNVVHENKEIRELLFDALKERGVENLTFKKSYDEYESIIEDIKNTYKDQIEWLEIDVDGMILNVRVEERIINKEEKKYNTCHIIATKSGIITSILTKKGVAEVKINDYVKKGDILISGAIKLNEEIKNDICANGDVYAEVWYTVSATIPLEYEEVEKTGKMRYNFMFKNGIDETQILKSRVEDKEVEKKRLLKIGDMEFYLEKEYEVIRETKKYSEEEAEEEAMKVIHEKLETNGIKIDNIMNEKVLKKSINNGNLDIEVFVAVKEQIGGIQYYNIEMERDTNDREYNQDNNGVNQ